MEQAPSSRSYRRDEDIPSPADEKNETHKRSSSHPRYHLVGACGVAFQAVPQAYIDFVNKVEKSAKHLIN